MLSSIAGNSILENAEDSDNKHKCDVTQSLQFSSILDYSTKVKNKQLTEKLSTFKGVYIILVPDCEFEFASYVGMTGADGDQSGNFRTRRNEHMSMFNGDFTDVGKTHNKKIKKRFKSLVAYYIDKGIDESIAVELAKDEVIFFPVVAITSSIDDIEKQNIINEIVVPETELRDQIHYYERLVYEVVSLALQGEYDVKQMDYILNDILPVPLDEKRNTSVLFNYNDGYFKARYFEDQDTIDAVNNILVMFRIITNRNIASKTDDAIYE